MEKKVKKCIIVIIILILILLCVLVAMKLKKNSKSVESERQGDENGQLSDADRGIGNYKLEKVRDLTKFYSIEKVLKDHEKQNFVAEQMRFLQGNGRASTYVVYGMIEDKKVFYTVRVDVINMTFEIKKKEAQSIDEISVEEDVTEIPNNGNNTFEYTRITNEEASRKYFEAILNLELNDTKKAYSILDEEYKKIRFPTYEDYEKYVSEMKDRLQISTMTKYAMSEKTDYREYTVVDNYNNTYTIRAKEVKDFTALLDNYTIKIDGYKEKYNSLSNEDKVKADIHIFVQMINTKDYTNAYNLFTDGFKQKYFKTVEDFEKYIKGYWFNYNIEVSAQIEQKGDVYMCTVTLKDGAGNAANSGTKEINVQLKDDINFAISFDPQMEYKEP